MIEKIISDFDKARTQETELRAELREVAAQLETLEEVRRLVDADVTAGIKFADELAEIDTEIAALKKQRDNISNRLRPAVDAVNRLEAESIPAISRALVERFDAVQACEAQLRESVDELKAIADMLPKRRWIWNRELSPAKRSTLCAHGLTDVIRDSEREYFEQLRGGLNE
jgi:chromosome segregation ATPase